MARRNLVYEAQVQAQAQVAPQFAALQEALVQARADRNAAIHVAAATSRGVGRAINRAGPQVRAAYKTSKLAAPAANYGSADYAQVSRNEQAVTGTALASSLGNALKELSDRRIEAAAGRAFRTQKALSDYQSAAATIATRRQSIAGQEGLYAASAYSKLAENQAQRDFQAQMKASEQAFSAHQNALSRRQQALTRQASAGQHAADQAAQAHQNALSRRASHANTVYSQRQQNTRQQRQIAASGSKSKAASGPKPTAALTYAGRQSILAWKHEYDRVGDGNVVAKDARGQKVPETIIRAAANLHYKNYIAPREVNELRNMGVVVPKEWQGVQVRPHTRRRRGRPTGTPRQGK
jgi:hypothetical protein